MIFFARSIKNALKKTRDKFTSRIKDALLGKVDSDRLEKMEQLLFEADLGSQMTVDLLDAIEPYLRKDPPDQEKIISTMKSKLTQAFPQGSYSLSFQEEGPTVIFIVGINGSGKTTSIAKLTKWLQNQGKSVLLVAADTFRAAAVEQLETWAHRTQAHIIKGSENADPSAVIFDGIQSAISKNIDVVLVDTAGRLQTKTDLMGELDKMKRVAQKQISSCPHEVLFVLDANSGQNGLSSASVFNDYIPLSGMILSKIDSSAKGGIAVSIAQKMSVPIKFLGTGEKIEDFEEFEPSSFVEGLLD